MEATVATLNVQFIVSGSQIEMRPVSPESSSDCLPAKHFPTLRELEHEYIQRVMAHVDGNRTQAARLLGIDRVSLWRKLKQMEAGTVLT